MLVDAVVVNDEADLLGTRLDLLRDHVDHVVVAESQETFSGRRKPLWAAAFVASLPAHRDRVTVVEYTMSAQPTDRGRREAEARNCLVPVLRRLAPSGVVLLCDLDEIPSPEQCRAARAVRTPHVVPMATFYRRADWLLEADTPLLVGRALPVADVPDDLDAVRWASADSLPQLAGESGAHFSYLGHDAAQLGSKYASFSHAELDFPEASSARLLRLADWAVVDHIGRVDHRGHGLLRVIAPAQWSSLQRELHRARPETFAGPRRPPPRLVRLVAASLIDAVARERRPALLAAVRSPSALARPRALREGAQVLRRAAGLWRRTRAAS